MRHRSATDIANSGVPVKVGMALTTHKTVTMFMRYVHTEDDPIRAADDAVAQRRLTLIGGAPSSEITGRSVRSICRRQDRAASDLPPGQRLSGLGAMVGGAIIGSGCLRVLEGEVA